MKRVALALLLVSPPALAQRIATWKGLSAEAGVGAHASLTTDGPWLPNTLTTKDWRTLEVHDASDGNRVQVLERAEGLKLLLYVERTALIPHTLYGAKLAPTPKALGQRLDAQTPGMILHAGTKLEEVGPDDNGHSKVRIAWRWKGGSFEITGFVMTDKIGPVYDHVYTEIPLFDPDVTVAGNFELRDAPNGTVFVISKSTHRLELMTLARRAGFSLVRTGQGAVGWIATKLTKKIPRVDDDEDGVEGGVMGGIGGGGTGEGIAGGPTLPPRTPVFAAIDGAFAGEVDHGFRLTPSKEQDGWLQFEVKTRFGKAIVWARKP